MAQPAQRTRFGRIFPPDEAWLAKAPDESVLEPDLTIIDTHHHLWVRPDHRYLLHELQADLRTGHNVVATVFLQCHAMYRANGPEEMRPIGETEFVAGIAAMSDSGGYGPTRVAAGIVGFADLTLGDRVEAVLEAQIKAGGGRFRGVRHSGNWDADPIIGNGAPGPDVYRGAAFRAGLARLSALGLSLDAWVFHTQLSDVIDLARAFPATNIIMGHVGGVLGYGPYTGRRDEIFSIMESIDGGTGAVPECVDETWRHDDAGGLAGLPGCRASAFFRGTRRAVATLHGDLHRAFRRAPLHVREQLPGRENGHRLGRAMERVQAHRLRCVGGREAGAVPQYGAAHLPVGMKEP